MSLTYVFTKAVNDGTSTISKSETLTGTGDVRVDEAVTGATTSYFMSCSANTAQISGLYITCDQAATLKTNTAAGTDSFALQANEPLVWTNNDPAVLISDILSANITGLYLTVPTAVTAAFKARFIIDASV